MREGPSSALSETGACGLWHLPAIQPADPSRPFLLLDSHQGEENRDLKVGVTFLSPFSPPSLCNRHMEGKLESPGQMSACTLCLYAVDLLLSKAGLSVSFLYLV